MEVLKEVVRRELVGKGRWWRKWRCGERGGVKGDGGVERVKEGMGMERRCVQGGGGDEGAAVAAVMAKAAMVVVVRAREGKARMVAEARVREAAVMGRRPASSATQAVLPVPPVSVRVGMNPYRASPSTDVHGPAASRGLARFPYWHVRRTWEGSAYI